jgi:hypothetical protein
MRSLSTEDLLDAWERGVPKGQIERGVILASLTLPDAFEGAAAALPVGERDRRILALRAAMFGPRLTGLLTCEACGEQLELDLSVEELSGAPTAFDGDLAARVEGYEVWLRLPDSRDLLAAATAPPADAPRLLFRRCVVRAELDGDPIAAEALPEAVERAAGETLSVADPLADPRLALTCVECGHVRQVRFEAVAFLWTELDAWAARMQRDVHILASAYGWAEREILRLGPARRARYLQLVQE